MTVENISRRAGPFIGDGTVTAFPFEFKIFDASQIIVYKTNEEDAEIALKLNEDYTVSLNTDQDESPGGTITLAVPLESERRLALVSAIKSDQQVKVTNYDRFFPIVFNDVFDKLTGLIQQLEEQMNRALLTLPTDTMTPLQLRYELIENTKTAVSSAAKALQSETNAATSAATSKEYADKLLAFKDQIVTVSDNIKSVGVTAENAEAIAAIAKNLEELLKSKGYAAEAKGWAEKANAITGGQAIVAAGTTFPRSPIDRFADVVNVKDFGARGNGVHDDTKAIQLAIDYAAKIGSVVFAPAGKYLCTDTIYVAKNSGYKDVSIYGVSPRVTIFNFKLDNEEKDCFLAGTGVEGDKSFYFNGNFRNFSVYGGERSRHALAIIGCYAYLNDFYQLELSSGDSALYCVENIFQNTITRIDAYSKRGHCFQYYCGVGTTFIGCYAHKAGAGKAGYRLAGYITLIGCNGVDLADYWGIFGADQSSAILSDMPGTDMPVIHALDCNFERFSSNAGGGCALRIGTVRSCLIECCRFDRGDADVPFFAYIYARYSEGAAIHLRDCTNFLGTGNNEEALTPTSGYYFVSDAFTPFYFDGMAAEAFKNCKSYTLSTKTAYNPNYVSVNSDIYSIVAHHIHALSNDRVVNGVISYKSKRIAISGDAQTIDVSGYSRVSLSADSTSSVMFASFTQVTTSMDMSRNGDLYIEALDDNVTLKHTASQSRDCFFLKSEANVSMRKGQIIHFMRNSENCWFEV